MKKISKIPFYKDNQGNKLNLEEFMGRWKQGLQGVTPLQQTRVQFKSNWLIIVGVLAGIVMSFIAIKTLWWLVIILTGALFNVCVQQLGTWQKKKLLERFEDTTQNLEGGIK